MHIVRAMTNEQAEAARPVWTNWTKAVSKWAVRLCGCWHLDISRPFTCEGETYRACLSCGARRRFDAAQWKMTGEFYFAQSTPVARPSMASVRRRDTCVVLMKAA